MTATPRYAVASLLGQEAVTKRSPLGKAPIFIVGAPRSGTTLLQNLIASHPQTHSAPETHLFTKISRCLLYERNLRPIGKKALPAVLPGETIQRLFDDLAGFLPVSDNLLHWAATIDGTAHFSIKEIAMRLFTDLGHGNGTIFIEKSPPHVYFIDEIRRVFPEAKIVNIVRDPRDVIPSINRMLQQMGKHPRTVYERAMVWTGSVTAAEKAGLFTIKYEELVTTPEKTLAEVYDYLGLSGSNEPFAQHACMSRLTVKENERWKQNNFSEISTDRIGTFKASLSDEDCGLIEYLCGRHMLTYRYPKTHAPFSLIRLGREAGGYRLRRTRLVFRRALLRR